MAPVLSDFGEKIGIFWVFGAKKLKKIEKTQFLGPNSQLWNALTDSFFGLQTVSRPHIVNAPTPGVSSYIFQTLTSYEVPIAKSPP